MKNDIISMYNKYIINPINDLFFKVTDKKQIKELDEIYLRSLQNIEKSILQDFEILQKKRS